MEEQKNSLEFNKPLPEYPSPRNQKRDYSLDVLKLVGGTTGAQLISFLTAPVVTRIFSPDDFGLAANFSAIIAILAVIVCMRYEMTIMLPNSKEDAVNMLGVSIFVTLFVSILSFPLLWISKGFIITWLKTPEILPFFWLIPVTTFLTGIFQALNYWNSRSRKYLRLSIAQVARNVGEQISKIGIGLAGFATSGVMIGTIAFGQALSTVILFIQFIRDDFIFFKKNISLSKMWEGARRYKKFPIYSSWSSFLNILSQQLPTFMLTAYFSMTITGYYNMGNKILRIPLVFIGNSLAQVFYQRASKAHYEGNLINVVKDTIHRLIVLGLFPMLVITFAGREIFILVFGSRWADAGVYSQILSIWSFFVLISAPISTLINILEKNEFFFVFNIILITSRFITLMIGGMTQNILFTLVLYSVTGTFAYLYFQFYLCNLVGIPFKQSILQILRNLSLSAPFLGIIILSKIVTSNNAFLVTLASGIASILYYLVLYRTDNDINELITQIFAGIKNRLSTLKKK